LTNQDFFEMQQLRFFGSNELEKIPELLKNPPVPLKRLSLPRCKWEHLWPLQAELPTAKASEGNHSKGKNVEEKFLK